MLILSKFISSLAAFFVLFCIKYGSCYTGFYPGNLDRQTTITATGLMELCIEACAEKLNDASDGSADRLIYGVHKTSTYIYHHCYCIDKESPTTAPSGTTWLYYIPAIERNGGSYSKGENTLEVFYLEIQSENKTTDLIFFDDLANPVELSTRIGNLKIHGVGNDYQIPSYKLTNNNKTKNAAKATYTTYNNNYLELERYFVHFHVYNHDQGKNKTVYFASVTSNSNFTLVNIAVKKMYDEIRESELSILQSDVEKHENIHELTVMIQANATNTAEVQDIFTYIRFEKFFEVISVVSESTEYIDPNFWFVEDKTLILFYEKLFINKTIFVVVKLKANEKIFNGGKGVKIVHFYVDIIYNKYVDDVLKKKNHRRFVLKSAISKGDDKFYHLRHYYGFCMNRDVNTKEVKFRSSCGEFYTTPYNIMHSSGQCVSHNLHENKIDLKDCGRIKRFHFYPGKIKALTSQSYLGYPINTAGPGATYKASIHNTLSSNYKLNFEYISPVKNGSQDSEDSNNPVLSILVLDKYAAVQCYNGIRKCLALHLGREGKVQLIPSAIYAVSGFDVTIQQLYGTDRFNNCFVWRLNKVVRISKATSKNNTLPINVIDRNELVTSSIPVNSSFNNISLIITFFGLKSVSKDSMHTVLPGMCNKVGTSREAGLNSCKTLKRYCKELPSGIYWLNSSDSSGEVFCDMLTDGGGWTLASRYVIAKGINKTQELGTIFDVVSSNFTMSIDSTKYGPIFQLLYQRQLRFYCYDDVARRTFHIKTMPNEFFDKLHYLLVNFEDQGESACGSFATLADDNSYMSQHCDQWGKDDGDTNFVGKWSRYGGKISHTLYQGLIYISEKARWHYNIAGHRSVCDQWMGSPQNGKWEIYFK